MVLMRMKTKSLPFLLSLSLVICVVTSPILSWAGELEDAKERVRKNPNLAFPSSDLGWAYIKLGRYQEAIHPFKEAIRINPNFSAAHFGVAFTYGKLGQYQDAIVSYKEYIQIKPDDANAHTNLGFSYNRLGKYRKAIIPLEEAIRLAPNEFDGHNQLGLAYNNLGKYQKAVTPLKEAIRLNPDFSIGHYNLGVSYQNLARNDEAIVSFKEAVRLKPDDSYSYSRLGFSYNSLGRYQEAVEAYREAIRLNPYDPGTHNDLGVAYKYLGRHDEALEEYKVALRLDSDNALFRNNLTSLEKEIAQGTTIPLPQVGPWLQYYNLGDSHINGGRNEEAIAPLKEAIRLKPSYANAHSSLGLAYINFGKYQEAISPLKEAIRLNPNDSYAYSNLGVVYNHMGKYQDAIVSLKEAIRLNPDDSYSYNELGISYSYLNRFQKAIESHREAIRLNPNDSYAYSALGSVYLSQGKINAALGSAKDADQIKPNDPDTLGLLGTIYWELDNPEKAMEVLEQALRSKAIPPYLVIQINANLSEVYEKLGRHDDAIKAAKKALEIDYDDPFANFILGLSYDGKLDGVNAISHMRVAAKGFQKQRETYTKNDKWGTRNNRKYQAKSQKKLREFYSKYNYSPEDFGETGSVTSSKTPMPNKPAPPKEGSAQSGTGSGFFVSKLGHVITNAHVVKGCNKVTVGDSANKQVPAEIINTDRSNDLALLKLSSLEMASADSKSLIQKLNIIAVPVASKGLLRSEDVKLGEKVLVAGFPFGDFFSNSIKVTTGIVSSTRGAGDDSGQFQLDAAVQPGNSGGPIYDSGGNIVGVVVSQLDKLKVAKAIGSLPENMNFGIKASTVRQFLTSSGLPSKKAGHTEEKSTQQLAEIAKNQALMVMCYQ
jgi:tetratricopeptide (TPR) repeat protein